MRTTLPLLGALALIASPAAADPPDIHVDVPSKAKGLEVNLLEHDFTPGETSGWHIHHGYEIAYVLSGAINVQIAGGPIRHVSKGDTFEVERNVPHRLTNGGTEPAALLMIYLKDKSAPTKIPVPPPSVR